MSGPDQPPTSGPGAAKPGATQPGAPQAGAANPSAANPGAANPATADDRPTSARPTGAARVRPAQRLGGRDVAGPPRPVRPARHRRGDPLSRVLAGAGVLLVLVAAGLGARAAAGPAREAPAAVRPERRRPAPPPADRCDEEPGRPLLGTGHRAAVAGGRRRPPRAGRTRPVSVSIPSIGVRSSLIPLALLPATGELAAPAEFDQAGWYADGPVPGEPGPAVIAGHVDSPPRPGDLLPAPRAAGPATRSRYRGPTGSPPASR